MDKSDISYYLAKALGTIDRARGLTAQLLTFSKGGVPIKKIERLSPFIEETAKFSVSGSNVTCNFAIAGDLWPCEFDRNQIGQVINNIVINAQQAMPEGGSVEIKAENLRLAENVHAVLPSGNYVKIAITDHGIGMPRDILTKIFDPFYTTKSKGHGLGLAIAYSIIHRHKGCIEVNSESGKGSTFTFYLPASPGTLTSDKASTITHHHGSGTILVMDDEEVVREALSAILQTVGYRTHCVSNSREAIDLFIRKSKEEDRFTALFLDLTIPGECGGKDTIREIRKIDKDILVFVTSGYADDPVIANPTEYGFNGSLCKPFRTVELFELLNMHIKMAK